MKILVTGGAGYIGSHTCLALLKAGYDVHVIDNLSNGRYSAIKQIQALSKRSIGFTECDIRNKNALTDVFFKNKPDAVIHFAGLKSVKESVEAPAKYYEHNVGGASTLLRTMARFGCAKIIFSSSATVYGDPKYLPYDEKHPTQPVNPYGRSKLYVEELLRDWVNVDNHRRAVVLRYFNPVGADASGLIGEDPHGVPNNLMPYLSQVAVGRLPHLTVFGNDYNTKDGTGMRDYIHVSDLADAHLAGLKKSNGLSSFEVINVGGGKATSVLEVVAAFERVSGKSITLKIASKRPGDLAYFYANTEKAKIKLNWKATLNIDDMVRDAWNWQKQNPNGYR